MNPLELQVLIVWVIYGKLLRETWKLHRRKSHGGLRPFRPSSHICVVKIEFKFSGLSLTGMRCTSKYIRTGFRQPTRYLVYANLKQIRTRIALFLVKCMRISRNSQNQGKGIASQSLHINWRGADEREAHGAACCRQRRYEYTRTSILRQRKP